MTSSNFKRGDWVVYVPGHAHGDTAHEDCERGTVTSVHPEGSPVFVVYGEELNAKATSPEDLISAEDYFTRMPRSSVIPATVGSHRAYLGDGLFVNFDGYNVVLSAENGVRATDIVYLEPGLLGRLNAWHREQIEPLYKQANEG